MEPLDRSVIFVSIDFEFKREGPGIQSIREIGICSLDTRDLDQSSWASHLILSTQNHIWKQKGDKNEGHGSKFIFGESNIINSR